MNIKELNGKSIKKALACKSASYRWHNKNKSGGNFGINLLGVNSKDLEITGQYDLTGQVYGLRIGLIYWSRMSVKPTDFNELMTMLKLFSE